MVNHSGHNSIFVLRKAEESKTKLFVLEGIHSREEMTKDDSYNGS